MWNSLPKAISSNFLVFNKILRGMSASTTLRPGTRDETLSINRANFSLEPDGMRTVVQLE